jgi:hypothetical protein
LAQRQRVSQIALRPGGKAATNTKEHTPRPGQWRPTRNHPMAMRWPAVSKAGNPGRAGQPTRTTNPKNQNTHGRTGRTARNKGTAGHAAPSYTHPTYPGATGPGAAKKTTQQEATKQAGQAAPNATENGGKMDGCACPVLSPGFRREAAPLCPRSESQAHTARSGRTCEAVFCRAGRPGRAMGIDIQPVADLLPSLNTGALLTATGRRSLRAVRAGGCQGLGNGFFRVVMFCHGLSSEVSARTMPA